jgi:PAS domain S-box-containing protein
MTEPASENPFEELDEQTALRSILEETSVETGEDFFAALVLSLQKALGVHGAWVTEYHPEKRRLRALSFCMGDELVHDYEFDIAGTPCEAVVDSNNLVHFPDKLLELYPDDEDLAGKGLVSYMGIALRDRHGEVMGHVAMLDKRPMPKDSKAIAIFRIFADRAAAEMQRLRVEHEARERELKLGRLLANTMDAIIELDNTLTITRLNPSAEFLLGFDASQAIGENLTQFLTPESRDKLMAVLGRVQQLPEGKQSSWVPGGLESSIPDHRIHVEATLSLYALNEEEFYTLVLRDLAQPQEVEGELESRNQGADLPRNDVSKPEYSDGIIGDSVQMKEVLEELQQVAETNTTVLILGETGTGKELIARAVHVGSPRKNDELVKVNCAAIPAALMESEFFGHEKGAFTGATEKREGRFAAADGGTLFLDEIGELPLDLQVKLLRVLQEGEFEPIGSNKTRKVNVRVIAATNRNLEEEIEKGTFRGDLYYRLNVFPLNIPRLQDRGDDVVVLAEFFVDLFASRLEKEINGLSDDLISRLKSYPWPGNVRELQNVIERAVITAKNNELNLSRIIPIATDQPSDQTDPETGSPAIRTAQEMQEFERENITRALDATGWRISGANGAAKMLGMNASTLASRIKSLNIVKPS